ncbi:aminotransferase class III-fold pyridoxal phosphate-dependent enzyme [Streptomyces sp. P38-E01]|uniref:Aminotransferase class III-fold pyridoxal phosphate-dependent enzyme n=1 Tax=Streptomyces tardus TaxID=2780544 RepID=A0A949JBK6_9ACTN|nr:aminotransferase class III-fold pyridoxal phosphate-dependent enzyme [Streptomyces tardus]MBU7597068.1 aminotransferase class III-fold pyridoxal phosphate-dependent enzyme [Streptomyces tardus]
MRLDRSFELDRKAEQIDALAAKRKNVIASDQMVEGRYPVFAERAAGAHFWDVDGNKYLDFFLSYGTVILGHADPDVDDAVVREIRRGFAVGLMKPVQTELVEELLEIIPGAEMGMLLKTGSDATGAAVRLSRAFTGRDRVVRWGYNGWHDWCAQWDNGIPEASRELVDTFTYNDLDSLRALFERHPDGIACVVMMPFMVEAPEPGFLEGVRELTREYGALLVFDEIRSAFRLALGGAQEHYGVTADLVTLSKAFANGYAVSALTGRADVLRTLEKVHISSTYYSNADAMAAALATIRKLRSGDHLAHIWRLGERLQNGLRELTAKSGVPVAVVGHPPMPFLDFAMGSEDDNQSAKRVFYAATIAEGVFFHPNHHWFVSAATTEADIDQALDAARSGFEALVAAGWTTEALGARS